MTNKRKTLGEMIVDFLDSKAFTYSWVGALVLSAILTVVLKFIS